MLAKPSSREDRHVCKNTAEECVKTSQKTSEDTNDDDSAVAQDAQLMAFVRYHTSARYNLQVGVCPP